MHDGLHHNLCRNFLRWPRCFYWHSVDSILGYLRRPEGGNSRTVRCFGTAASEHSIPALWRRTIFFPCTARYVKPRPPVDSAGNPAGSDYCVHNTWIVIRPRYSFRGAVLVHDEPRAPQTSHGTYLVLLLSPSPTLLSLSLSLSSLFSLMFWEMFISIV